ncbi:MAG: HAD domain-containing protein [Myxococcota bacterium]
MDRLLFLDIDGVLNSGAFLAERSASVSAAENGFDASVHIDATRVARLNRLVEVSGARVILASTWRMVFGLERTQRSLRAKGFQGALADETVRLLGHPRHMEIRHYLAQFESLPNFVVLDDDIDAGVGFGEHFVHVLDGLEDAHVEAALAVLERARPSLQGVLPFAEI